MFETLAILAPIVAIALIVTLCRSPLVGAALVLAMTVANAWFVELPGIELGVMLYPTDAVALLLALAASFRITAKRSIRVPPSGLIFTAMLVLSFVIGLAEFGQTAGVDFRVIFAFIAGVFYFSSFEINSELVVRLARVWIVAACTLMLIAWFVWVADAAGLTIARKWIDADSTGVKFRVLNSSYTYIIGVGLVMLLHFRMHNQMQGKWQPLLLVLGITVLVLQHRSVWIATFAALVLVFLLARRGRGILVLFAGVVFVIAIAALPLVGDRFSTVSESVSSQATRAAEVTKGTFGGRLRAWDKLLADWQSLGLLEQLVGRPFGSSYARMRNSPHNCYLQVMYRTGYIGLLAMLWLYGGTLIKLFAHHRRREEDDVGTTALLFSIIAAQLLFFIPYGFIPAHGILMGFAVAYLQSKTTQRRSAMFQGLRGIPAITDEAQRATSHWTAPGVNTGPKLSR